MWWLAWGLGSAAGLWLLMRHLQGKEQALRESYQRLERLAREQARSAERTRILRDMHDSVGAHLSAAIRQVQSGQSSQQAILQSLQEAMDQLKLSIDAFNLIPGDVSTLLANLRYRLAPRFAASDLQLHWDVAQMEPLPFLDSTATRHVQFVLYEALSNVCQHSQATRLDISLTAQGDETWLTLTDNGVGFAAPDMVDLLKNDTISGKGLRSMALRAQAMGALLQWHSQPGCTSLQLRLKRPPHERRAKARVVG